MMKKHPDAEHIEIEKAAEALSFCGFIEKTGSEIRVSVMKKVSASEKLRIQSNSEITAPANTPLSTEIIASLCGKIKNYDLTRTYELDKKAFSSALATGLDFGEIIEHLSKYSDGGIPQNIVFSINAWNREYSSIKLNYGIVMTVSEDRLPLIKHSPSLQQFITSQPAPGVFILDPERETEWRQAFLDSGFDILPPVLNYPEETGNENKSDKSSFRITGEKLLFFEKNYETDAESIIKKITDKISSSRFSTDQKKKLEARARKKLILSESQITVSSKPEESGEAGGLDHQAKIRLANRALELENLLEITVVNDLDLEKKLIKPVKVVKSEAELPDKPPVYIIEGIELPEEELLNIPITKISFMKMLKSSLFTP